MPKHWKFKKDNDVDSLSPQIEKEKPVFVPKPYFDVFRCELSDLKKELNSRFPEGDVQIQHIAHFGSACEVVVKRT